MKLFRFRSLSNLETHGTDIRRAFSEANLTSIEELETLSSLTVNSNRANVGEKITVSWQICVPCHARDWIGLFYVENYNAEDCLDSRTKSIGRSPAGSVSWLISKDLAFKEVVNRCHFKYFHGLTGEVLATSRMFYVCVPYSLMKAKTPTDPSVISGAETLLIVSVAGLRASGLKKSFFGKPNPYVKLFIVPRFRYLASLQRHHGQKAKTFVQNGVVNPVWANEVHVFHATGADLLEFEIHNRGGARPTLAKFLGKVSLPLASIIDSIGYDRSKTITQPLVGRTPADKVQGTFSVTILVRQSSQRARYSSQTEDAQPSSATRPRLDSRSSAPVAYPEYSSSEEDEESPPMDQRDRTRPISCYQMNTTPSRGSAGSAVRALLAREQRQQLMRNGTGPLHLDNGHNASGSSTSDGEDVTRSYTGSPVSSSGLSTDAGSSCSSRNLAGRTRSVSPTSSSADSRRSSTSAVMGSLAERTASSPSNESQDSTENNEALSAPEIDSAPVACRPRSHSRMQDTTPQPAYERLPSESSSRSSSEDSGSITNEGSAPPQWQRPDCNGLVRDEIELVEQDLSHDLNWVEARTPASSPSQQTPAPLSSDQEPPVLLPRFSSLDSSPRERQWSHETGTGIADSHDHVVRSQDDNNNGNTDAQQPAFAVHSQGAPLQHIAANEIDFQGNEQRPTDTDMTDVCSGTATAAQDDTLPSGWSLQCPVSSSVADEWSAQRGHEVADVRRDQLRSPSGQQKRLDRRPVSMFDATPSKSRNRSYCKAIFDVDDPQPSHKTQRYSWTGVAEVSPQRRDPSPVDREVFSEQTENNASPVCQQTTSGLMNHEGDRQGSGAIRETSLLGDEFFYHSSSSPAQMRRPPFVKARSSGSEETNSDVIPNLQALIANIPTKKRPLCHTSSDPTSSLRRKAKDGGNGTGESSGGARRAVVNATSNKNFPLSRTDEAARVERTPVPINHRRRHDVSESIASGHHDLTSAPKDTRSDATTEARVRHTTLPIATSDAAVASNAEASVRPRTTTRPVFDNRVDPMSARPMSELRTSNVLASSGREMRTHESLVPADTFFVPVADASQPPSLPARFTSDSGDAHSTPDNSQERPDGIESVPGGRHSPIEPPLVDRQHKPTRRSLRGQGPPSRSDANNTARSSLDSLTRKAMTRNVRQKAAKLERDTPGQTNEARSVVGDRVNKEPRKLLPQAKETPPAIAPRALASRNRARQPQPAGPAIQDGGRPPEIIRVGTRSEQAVAATAPQRRTDQVPATEDEEPLPSNWERAVDSHERIYYIDHNTRTTTWNRPTRGSQPSQQDRDVNSQLAQLDRRYRSLRRTISDGAQIDSDGESDSATRPVPSRLTPNQGVTATPAATTAGQSSGTEVRRAPSVPRRVGSLADTPGCRFILRRDFFQFLNNNGSATRFIQRNPSVSQIVNRIRSEPGKFERYQHSRDLITLLNFFAKKQASLPTGWEQKVDQFGQSYFIDHGKRSTTFIDPRLPLDDTSTPRQAMRTEGGNSSRQQAAPQSGNRTGGPRSSRGAPPPPPVPSTRQDSRGTTASQPTCSTYNERVVAFLRQPGIDSILAEKFTDLPSKHQLRRKLNLIQRDGARVVEKYCNDVELVILLSMFEEEIQTYAHDLSRTEANSNASSEARLNPAASTPPSGRTPAPYRRDFEAKLRTFHKQMTTAGYAQGPGKIRMKIRRTHVIEDAYEQLMRQTTSALQKDRLYIRFTGEEGLDYGGPAREFFFLISRQLFNPYYGLFEYSASDTYTLQVSPASLYVDNAHNWFRFCGRILALALIHQHLLDVFFARTIYKALLRQPFDLSDLEGFDAEYHQSLTWILENDITHAGLDLTFSVSDHIFGKVTERELKPGGEHIAVNERNKRDYVELMVKWRVERGVGEQINQLIRGFSEVLELSMVSLFDARELELVIAGTADIDLKDWRTNTDYRSGYHDKHQIVEWFWMALAAFTNEQNLRLLQFVTGTSSIPCEGFAALRGSTGLKRFTIDCWGTPDMLPRAHTCFNRLDLPPYRNFNELQEKLLYATEETSTFGIE